MSGVPRDQLAQAISGECMAIDDGKPDRHGRFPPLIKYLLVPVVHRWDGHQSGRTAREGIRWNSVKVFLPGRR
jgi:hypothetical protein